MEIFHRKEPEKNNDKFMSEENKQKLRQEVHNMVERAMDKAEGQYDKVNVKVRDTREKTNKYVQENAQKALLMAAGAGALTTMLFLGILRRKRKGRHCDEYGDEEK